MCRTLHCQPPEKKALVGNVGFLNSTRASAGRVAGSLPDGPFAGISVAIEGTLLALIKCPDCGRDVSDLAPSCPNCGRPIAQARGPQSPTQPRSEPTHTT